MAPKPVAPAAKPAVAKASPSKAAPTKRSKSPAKSPPKPASSNAGQPKALIDAVKAGDLNAVNAALAGPAVNAPTQEGSTPLHLALALPEELVAVSITDALLKKGAKLDATDKAQQTPLLAAVVRGRAALVSALAVSAGEALEFAPPGGPTPLVAAVKAGKQDVVDALLAAGAKLTTQDATGVTPLMALVQANKGSEAMALLERGDCGLTAVDAQGLSVLAMACSTSSPDLDLVRALLAKGASPDTQDRQDGATPILRAVAAGQAQLAEELVRASKQIELRNSKGESALSLALAVEGPTGDSLVAAVLGAGASPGQEGPAMLKKAVDSRKDVVAAALVRALTAEQVKAAKLDFEKLAQDKMVHTAAVVAVRAALDKGSADAAMDDEGNTQLHLVAAMPPAVACYDLCLALCRMGLGPNTANKAGDTPLHRAAMAGNVEACKALVDGGSDPLKRNGKNRKPREQVKCPDSTKDWLLDAEEAAKNKKALKSEQLFGEKVKATQTESAFGLQVI